MNQPIQQRGTSAFKLALAAVCLALCLVLPFLTGQIPEIGNALCPMHIPVLLCGFVCGFDYAAAVGLIAPLLRFALFGMPPMPMGLAMCVELAAYGAISGAVYARLPRRTSSIYVALLSAMLGGRIVWGVARVLMTGLTNVPFTWALFLAGAFTNAIPGIIVQLVLIPVLVMALQSAFPWMKRTRVACTGD